MPQTILRKPRPVLGIWIGIGLTVLFTGAAWHDATEIASGAPHQFDRGRGRGLDHLVYGIAGVLGPAGVLLAGGAVAAILTLRLTRTLALNRGMRSMREEELSVTYADWELEEFRQEYALRQKRGVWRVILCIPATLAFPVGAVWGAPLKIAMGVSVVSLAVLFIGHFRDWRCPACGTMLGKRGAVRPQRLVVGAVRKELMESPFEGSARAPRFCPGCDVRLV